MTTSPVNAHEVNAQASGSGAARTEARKFVQEGAIAFSYPST